MTVDEPVLVRDLDSLPPFAGDGFTSRVLADETVGVEHVSVGVIEFDPGARGSPHVREVEEVVFVLDGEGRIVTDDATDDLTTGQAAVIPPGVRHAHENTGDEVLRKRWIFAHQGPERAIRDRGATGGDDDE